MSVYKIGEEIPFNLNGSKEINGETFTVDVSGFLTVEGLLEDMSVLNVTTTITSHNNSHLSFESDGTLSYSNSLITANSITSPVPPSGASWDVEGVGFKNTDTTLNPSNVFPSRLVIGEYVPGEEYGLKGDYGYYSIIPSLGEGVEDFGFTYTQIPEGVWGNLTRFKLAVSCCSGISEDAYLEVANVYTIEIAEPIESPTLVTATGVVKAGKTLTLKSETTLLNAVREIYYSSDGGVNWNFIGSNSTGNFTYTIPTSYNSSTIIFRSRIVDGYNYSDFLNSVVYNLSLNNPPNSPTSLTISGNTRDGVISSGDVITLTSEEVFDIDNESFTYMYYYSTNDGVSWESITNSNRNITTWTVPTSLKGSIKFKVQTFDGIAYSNMSYTTPSFTLNVKPVLTLVTADLLEFGERSEITFSGRVLDSDSNQTVSVYAYPSGSDVRFKLGDTSSGSIQSFESKLTYRNNTLFDVTGNAVWSNVNSGGAEVQFNFYAVDSIGGTSDTIKRTFVFHPNNAPILTLTSDSSMSFAEGIMSTVNYSLTDLEGDELTLTATLRGQGVPVSLPNDSSFTLRLFNSDLYLNDEIINSNKLNDGTLFLDLLATDSFGNTTLQVINLVISVNVEPKIIFNKTPNSVVKGKTTTFTGFTEDADSLDELTMSVSIDGGSFEPIALNDSNEFSYQFTSTAVGVHDLIFATFDGKVYKKVLKHVEVLDDRLEFTFKNPFETDAIVLNAKVLMNFTVTDDAEFEVLFTNNPFDAEPHWQDITQKVIDQESFAVENTTVDVAYKCGVNLRVKIVKNNAPVVAVGSFGILIS